MERLPLGDTSYSSIYFRDCTLGQPDISIASAREFAALRLQHDNLTQVHP